MNSSFKSVQYNERKHYITIFVMLFLGFISNEQTCVYNYSALWFHFIYEFALPRFSCNQLLVFRFSQTESLQVNYAYWLMLSFSLPIALYSRFPFTLFHAKNVYTFIRSWCKMNCFLLLHSKCLMICNFCYWKRPPPSILWNDNMEFTLKSSSESIIIYHGNKHKKR